MEFQYLLEQKTMDYIQDKNLELVEKVCGIVVLLYIL